MGSWLDQRVCLVKIYIFYPQTDPNVPLVLVLICKLFTGEIHLQHFIV